MNRTQTPQIIASVIAIVLLTAYAVTGFSEVAYICMALVAIYLGAALMLDYDEWLSRKKEERLNQEAINMLVKDKENRMLVKLHVIDEWKRFYERA